MHTKRAAWRIMLGLLLASMMLSACGGGSSTGPNGGPVFGGTIIDGILGEPDSLLPELSGGSFAGQIQQAIWAPLFYTNDQAQIVPGLASSFDLSADAKTITIHLRPNLTWSDGTALTADDVAFTLGLFQRSASTVVNGFQGSEIASVSALDSTTVQINLNTADATFVGNSLTNSAVFAPLPKHKYDGMTLDQLRQSTENLHPSVSSGPFQVSQVAGDITVVRNPHYFLAPLPYLDKVVFKVFSNGDTRFQALEAGEINVASLFNVNQLDQLRTDPSSFHPSRNANAFEALWLNESNAILADPQVRLALALSVDPRAEIQAIWHNTAWATCDDSVGTFAHEPALVNQDGLCAYGSSGQTFNLTTAATLLDTDGWIKGSDGFRHKGGQTLTLRFSVNLFSPYRLQSEQMVAHAWSQLGIQVQITNYSGGSGILFPRTPPSSPTYDVAEVEWFVGIDPDSRYLWESNQTPPQGGSNLTFYNNPQVDAWEQQQAATPNMSSRLDLFHKIHTQLLKDVPLIYLYAVPDLCEACPNLHNYNPSGVGASETWNIQDWWIQPSGTADIPQAAAVTIHGFNIPRITCHGT